MSVLPVTYICVYHVHAHRDQKRSLDLLELELKTVMSLDVGAENLTWVICKSIKCFNYCVISPAPASGFLKEGFM